MATFAVENIRQSTKNWFLLLILGVIMIIVGIMVFRTPVASYLALSILFSVTFLATGLLEVVYAISNRREIENWGWSLAGGIVDLLIGFLLVTRPDISLTILPFFVGFALMFRSIMSIAWSIELKRLGVSDWGSILLVGILGVILSFILLWNPLFAGMTIVFYTAISFILIGIFQIYLAFRLRRLKKQEELSH